MTFNLNSTTVAVIFGDAEQQPQAGALPAEPVATAADVPGFSIFARARRRSPVRAGGSGPKASERAAQRPRRHPGASGAPR